MHDGIAERLADMDPATRAAVCRSTAAMMSNPACGAFGGFGAGAATAPAEPVLSPWVAVAGTVGMGLGVFHGYRRNHGSVGWAIGWGLFGALMPIIAIPLALAEGFGEPSK